MNFRDTWLLFLSYLKSSTSEILENFKLYFVYIFGLILVSLTQSAFDFILTGNFISKAYSKILFSIIPILIIGKILYVIKIRQSGSGSYSLLVSKFILYNFFYFIMLFVSLLLYLLPGLLAYYQMNSKLGFVVTLFLLFPFIYIVIFYGLTPFVAVFSEKDDGQFFRESKRLSQKNIYLVVLNHLFFLMIPLVAQSFYYIQDIKTRLIVSWIYSIPESIYSIILTLVTAKIYFHLAESDT